MIATITISILLAILGLIMVMDFEGPGPMWKSIMSWLTAIVSFTAALWLLVRGGIL